MKFIICHRVLIPVFIAVAIFFLFPITAWGIGYLQGYVYNDADPVQPIAGARIETDFATATSFFDGFYIMALPEGSYTVTISATNYQMQSIVDVGVVEDNTTNLDFTLGSAALKLEAVYPTLGQLGQNLDVELTGTSFDENTRVSMALDSGSRRKIIGSVDTNVALGITVIGDMAYVAGNTHLHLIDISDSENPQIIGSVVTPGYANAVAVAGDRAYVADGNSGLQVVNVSDQENPLIIGSVDTPGSAYGVVVAGENVYVADLNEGLQVIDTTDPEPTNWGIIGSVDTPGYAKNVTVVDDRAYVADDTYGLQVIDISDPEHPQTIGSTMWTCQIWDVVVIGDMAYAASSGCGFQVFDVSDPNPANWVLISSVETPGIASSITVIGSRAYVTTGDLQVIDISDPEHPKIIGSVDTPGAAEDVAVIGGTAYMADYADGLCVINISDLQIPQVIASVDTPSPAAGVAAIGDTVYLAIGWSGLQVFDISDSEPANWEILRSFSTPSAVQDVAVVGDRAYLANWGEGLQVIDISDPEPANWGIIGSVDTPGDANAVAVAGNRVYVADYHGGLCVIDISNPEPGNWGVIRSVPLPDIAYGVTVIDNKVYVANNGAGLQVIDISDPEPANWGIFGSVDMPYWAFGVTVVGNMAYVANASGLQVIDISDPEPTNWGIIGSVDTPGSAKSVTVVDDRAYVADGGNGIQVIDISDPEYPIIGSVDTPGQAYRATVINNTAYVADGMSGFTVVPVPLEIKPVNVTSETNISLVLPSPQIAGHYTLRVFNGSKSYELVGAVSFSDDLTTLNSKAIIVAGGGPDAPGEIWEETKLAANRAYDVLIQQGFDHESIYYLSMETGNEFVDKASLDTFLYDAISNWAGDGNTSELLLYLVDHGEPDNFIMYADGEYSQKLSVQDLDQWLDDLQNGPLPGSVTFIYDACQSGSFVSKLRPPENKDRIVITSASSEPAYFLEQGVESFSFHFWSSILQRGGKLGEAFSDASQSMNSYQIALIDANKNGIENEQEDFDIAGEMIVQRGSPVYQTAHPFVTSVSGAQILSGNISATIWASGIIDAESVTATIIPPDINPATAGIPITDLPTITLTDPDGDGVYEGIYDDQGEYSGFNKEGTYIIVVKALTTQEFYSYVSGSMVSQKLFSPSLYTSVTQTSGIQNIEADGYEDDDIYTQASIIFVDDVNTQPHNFHEVDDQDWVFFYGIAGKTYKIKAGNLSVVCDTVIEVYNGDGSPRPEGPYSSGGAGEDELVDWTCPEDGVYFVKATNFNDNYGENVKYDLSIYLPIGGVGTVVGQVKDLSENGIDGVKVESDIGGAYTYTLGGGWYTLTLVSGTHILTATHPNYAPQTMTVTVQDGNYLPDNTFIMPLADTDPPTAILSDAPSGTINYNTITISIGGEDVVQYRFKIDNGAYSTVLDVSTSVWMSNLTEGYHTLSVIGKDSAGNWQAEEDATIASWEIVSPGNVNGDETVGLDDAVLALQTIVGMEPAGVDLDADVNGDGKIGIEEFIFILQEIAGLRD